MCGEREQDKHSHHTASAAISTPCSLTSEGLRRDFFFAAIVFLVVFKPPITLSLGQYTSWAGGYLLRDTLQYTRTMQVTHIVAVVVFLFLLIWGFMLITLVQLPTGTDSAEAAPIQSFNKFVKSITAKHKGHKDSTSGGAQGSLLSGVAPTFRRTNLHRKFIDQPVEVNRALSAPKTIAPPPMAEIEKNMTLYLTTLHKRLSDLAGPTVTAMKAWDTFLEVTKEMPMKWDEENKVRFPQPRQDGSIFVSLGTYRDPFCPMTIKSLYENARYPDRLFVGMFQQNCFGPKCRTGVLKGGVVEDAGPDIDCYQDFCASAEGIRSRACVNGNVHLFNVNESESLGPYMARYLGAKFYRGEQYYLQIDSHSEFIKDWDQHLIKMVTDAPAEKPVISTYPPDSQMNWRGTVGYRMCDSEFAKAQIGELLVAGECAS
jgi:uncharacterized Fe-S cluster protein YjdI